MSESISKAEASSARLHFLSSAGHLLATSAPAVSAHLMRERDDFFFEQESTAAGAKLRKSLKPEKPAKGSIASCMACNTISIPGRTVKVEVIRLEADGKELVRDIEAKRRRKRVKGDKRNGRTPKKRKGLKMTCQACRSSELETLPLSNSQDERREAKVLEKTTKESQSVAAVPKLSANAGSKARAKARKHSGLQNMLILAKAKQDQKGAGGLMDWMDKAT